MSKTHPTRCDIYDKDSLTHEPMMPNIGDDITCRRCGELIEWDGKKRGYVSKSFNKEGLRLYFFVMYNLSGIQKGIQAGHAAVEYGLKYGKTKIYKEFAKHHKTFILLAGGGSEDMLNREKELKDWGVDFASFNEPDLNNSISAIAFIVPEEIYGKDLQGLDDIFTVNLDYTRYLKSFRLASN